MVANVLRFIIKRKRGKKKADKILVLAIPRGGGLIVSDIVIPRKLTAPDNKDLSIVSKFQLEAAIYEH